MSQDRVSGILLHPESQEYEKVKTLFFNNFRQRFYELAPKLEILTIHKVHNNSLWTEYCRKREDIKQELGHEAPVNERYLFHGTNVLCINSIVKNGFDPAATRRTRFGQGTYFSDASSLCHYFATPANSGEYPEIIDYPSNGEDAREDVVVEVEDPEVTKTRNFMLCALVILGRSTQGDSRYAEPPLVDPGNTQGPRYHSCFAKRRSITGKEYVIFDRDQMYPQYLIQYEFEKQKDTGLIITDICFLFIIIFSLVLIILLIILFCYAYA